MALGATVRVQVGRGAAVEAAGRVAVAVKVGTAVFDEVAPSGGVTRSASDPLPAGPGDGEAGAGLIMQPDNAALIRSATPSCARARPAEH